MNKSKLIGFIDKYSLGGMVESVKWDIAANKLITHFSSTDKSLVGEVVLNEFEMPDASFGVYTTSKLQKMLGAMDADIEITPQKIGERYINLKITDKDFKMNYVLSDPAIIPTAAKLKTLPDFELTIKADTAFVDKFLRARAAIAEATGFAIQSHGDEVNITMGYSNNNTDRTAFSIVGTCTSDIGPKLFNIDTIKNILLANKDCDNGTIEISSRGLAKLTFSNKNYQTVYFIVELQNAE